MDGVGCKGTRISSKVADAGCFVGDELQDFFCMAYSFKVGLSVVPVLTVEAVEVAGFVKDGEVVCSSYPVSGAGESSDAVGGKWVKVP